MSDRRAGGVSPEVARLSSGAGVALAGKLGGRGLQFGSQLLLARVLGPEPFGLYALGWTVVNLLRQLAPLGMEHGVVRLGAPLWPAKLPDLRSVLRASLSLALAGSVTAAVLLYVLAGVVAERAFGDARVAEILRLFAVACPFAAIIKVASAATRLAGGMGASVVAEDVAQPAAAMVLIPAAHVLAAGAPGAVVATVASFGFAAVVALAVQRRALPGLARTPASAARPARALLAFSLPATLAASTTLFIVLADRVILGHFRAIREVGIYQAVSQITMFFLVILNGINTVLQPQVPTLDAPGDREKLGEVVRVGIKWALYLCAPVALVLALLPLDAVLVLFGRPYAEGALALRLLSAAQLFLVASGPVGLVLILSGRQRRWLAASSAVFVANVGLDLALIPRYGLVGAASATLFSTASLLATALLMLRASLGITIFDRRFAKGAAAALATGALLAALNALAPWSPAVRLVLAALAAPLAFGVVLWRLGLDDEDLHLLRLIRSRYSRLARPAG